MQLILRIQGLGKIRTNQTEVTNTPQKYCIYEKENAMNMPQKIFVYTNDKVQKKEKK